MLVSPFKNLSKNQEQKLTLLLSFSTFILLVAMLYLDSFLKNAVCKHGIVSFQLAKDITTSNEIINSWNEVSQIACGISLGLDFLFLISYTLLIAILIHKLNEVLWKNSSIYNLGITLIYFLALAAAFDAVENIGLIQLLLGNIEQKWSSIAFYFAVPKFIIIVIGIIYILFNFVYYLFQKRS